MFVLRRGFRPGAVADRHRCGDVAGDPGPIPRYGRLFGGKQGARSIHFLVLCALAAFVVVHVLMVIVHGIPGEFSEIFLGAPDRHPLAATIIGSSILLAVVVVHIVATVLSRREYHRVNGYAPDDTGYAELAADGFQDYRLPVGGLVEHPVTLSLPQLAALGTTSQITNHNCIQGWKGIAE